MSRAALFPTYPRLRLSVGEAAGAVADLGTFVPLVAALVLVNGLDAGAVLLMAGLTVIGAGLLFGIPFPVQPLKALTAVAVAHRLAPEVIHAAGIEIAVFLLFVSMGRVADLLARVFTKPIVRALQFGVGALLVLTAARLVIDPPSLFRGVPAPTWLVALALAGFALIVWSAKRRAYGVALALLGAGVLAIVLSSSPSLGMPSIHLPELRLPHRSSFSAALFLLVIPQLPLTFGNAVVAVSDVSRDYFGERARRVTPRRVCFSAGAANLASGLVGGMPMCHGAGGLTSHFRLGARTAGMNLLLGGTFLVLGVFFAPQIPMLLGLLPVWMLAALLMYSGIRHALLIQDLKRRDLAVALTAGLIGAAFGNLAITMALGLGLVHLPKLRRPIVGESISSR